MKVVGWMILVSSVRVAFAQPGAGPPPAPSAPAAPRATAPSVVAPPGAAAGAQDPATHPGFVVIDQTDASTAAGLQLSYYTLGSGAIGPRTLLRVAAHARYVDAATGLGAYVRVPFAYASPSSGASRITDVGDIEIGGIFSPRLSIDDVGLILRAGVTLPTGEGPPASTVGAVTNLLALPDVHNSLSRATTLKLGVSPVVRAGPLFARLDLGFDWVLDVKEANPVVDADKVLHFNVGLGLDLAPVAVMLESENATLFGQGATVTLDALAISVRLNARPLSPYLALIVPVDGDLSNLLGVTFTAGVEFRP